MGTGDQGEMALLVLRKTRSAGFVVNWNLGGSNRVRISQYGAGVLRVGVRNT